MYKLVILGRDSSWANEVEAQVRAALAAILQNPDALSCTTSLPSDGDGTDPVVVVYLADDEAASDPEIRVALEEARSEAFSVLPISRDGDRIVELTPEVIRRLNAMTWNTGRQEVALRVLEHFGVAEKTRKLFLSYRRRETSALALQLRRALSERAFDVFLDRFSVPPGEDFQHRLDIELADKAFVLLLESPSAVGADWVQHEVAFALSHRISVLALTMPDTDQFEPVDDAFRLRLASADFDDVELGPDAELTVEALERVLAEVETRCARQLRRRRAQLLGSLNDFFLTAGFDRAPVGDWAVLATKEGEPARVCLVTPRSPTPHDFRGVDALRAGVGPETIGQVVHETPVLDPESQALIDWLVESRPLEPKRLTELP